MLEYITNRVQTNEKGKFIEISSQTTFHCMLILSYLKLIVLAFILYLQKPLSSRILHPSLVLHPLLIIMNCFNLALHIFVASTSQYYCNSKLCMEQ